MPIKFPKSSPGIQIVPSTVAGTQAGDLRIDSADSNKLKLWIGSAEDPIVLNNLAAQGANRLKNKDLEDSTTAIVDSSDVTKKILFNAGGTTGTTTTLTAVQTSSRVITLPDATTTLVGTDTADALSNKTQINVDNIQLDGNTISITNTDGNITISPNGTGKIILSSAIVEGKAASSLTIQSVSDQDINITAQGTGVVNIDNLILSGNTINTSNGNLTLQSDDSPIIVEDNLRGPTGGPFSITSDTDQNISIVANGSGTVTIEDISFSTNTITGPSASVFRIFSANNNDIRIAPNGVGIVDLHNLININHQLATEILTDNTTTGSDASLNAITKTFIKVTNASLASLTMIPAGTDGQIIILSNGTGNTFVVKNENGGTAANRILTGTGSSINIAANSSLILIYDNDSSRWRICGGAGGGGPPSAFGSRGTPRDIVAGTGITSGASHMSTTATEQLVFVQGSGGAVTITASPAIEAHTILGAKMRIIGTSNTATVTLNNASGLALNGNIEIGNLDILDLVWVGDSWAEVNRSG